MSLSRDDLHNLFGLDELDDGDDRGGIDPNDPNQGLNLRPGDAKMLDDILGAGAENDLAQQAAEAHQLHTLCRKLFRQTIIVKGGDGFRSIAIDHPDDATMSRRDGHIRSLRPR